MSSFSGDITAQTTYEICNFHWNQWYFDFSHVFCCRALRDNLYLHAMEEIYLKPDNPTSSTNHRGKKEVTETGSGLFISLITLVYFGGFSDSWFFPPFLFSGRRSSKRSFCLVGILSLCLLGAFLLARLTTFGIYCKLDCSSIFLLLYSPKIINSFLMKFYWNLTNMVTFKSRKSHKFKICKSF